MQKTIVPMCVHKSNTINVASLPRPTATTYWVVSYQLLQSPCALNGTCHFSSEHFCQQFVSFKGLHVQNGAVVMCYSPFSLAIRERISTCGGKRDPVQACGWICTPQQSLTLTSKWSVRRQTTPPASSTTQKLHGAPLNIMPFQLQLNKVCVISF